MVKHTLIPHKHHLVVVVVVVVVASLQSMRVNIMKPTVMGTATAIAVAMVPHRLPVTNC
jgi:hypothetical protein